MDVGCCPCHRWDRPRGDRLLPAGVQDLNRMDDRFNAIQQQITATAPATEAKPTDGKTTKRKKGGH